MFNAVVPAALALSLLLPVVAQAQNLPPQLDPKSDSTIVIRPGQWVAVGAGALAGFVVGDALFSTELGMVVAGVVGGYLGHVLYNGYQLEFRVSPGAKI
jgi:hypothetical protein